MRNWRTALISAALAAVSVYLIVGLLVRPVGIQWDFITYYHATKAYQAGADPYNDGEVSGRANTATHPFLYPPICLRLFELFTPMFYGTASKVWLWLKIVLLLPLVWVWRKYFVSDEPKWPFYLLALLAFTSPIYLDLKAGNVTIIEQVLLWTGFACLLKGRAIWFCVLVVAASLLKSTPLAFLLLLLVFRVPKRWWYFVGSLAAFGFVQVLDYLTHPDLFVEYVQKAAAWDERGADFNPSTLAMIKDLWQGTVNWGVSDGLVSIMSLILYGVVVVVVSLLAWRVIWPTIAVKEEGGEGEPDRKLEMIFLSCMLYAMLMPRFKIYAFILVMPAAYYVIRKYASKYTLIALFIILCLTTHPSLPVSDRFLVGLGFYYPMLTLYLLFGMWVAGSRSRLKEERLQMQQRP